MWSHCIASITAFIKHLFARLNFKTHAILNVTNFSPCSWSAIIIYQSVITQFCVIIQVAFVWFYILCTVFGKILTGTLQPLPALQKKQISFALPWIFRKRAGRPRHDCRGDNDVISCVRPNACSVLFDTIPLKVYTINTDKQSSNVQTSSYGFANTLFVYHAC